MRHRSSKSRISRLFGLAVLAYDIWRRLPLARRRQLLGLARRHGPTLLRSYKARRASGD